jgi:hypothetical protein
MRVSMGTPMFARTLERVCADAPCPRGHVVVSARMQPVRADASVLPRGNFITDAKVRPSHGQPSGHRPIVRLSVCPSVRYCPRDNLSGAPELTREHTGPIITGSLGACGR